MKFEPIGMVRFQETCLLSIGSLVGESIGKAKG
jgi:hypothetical protein